MTGRPEGRIRTGFGPAPPYDPQPASETRAFGAAIEKSFSIASGPGGAGAPHPGIRRDERMVVNRRARVRFARYGPRRR
jgi:hypothetical protein